MTRRRRSVANTRSAIKRIRQNEKRRQRNRAVRSSSRTSLKTARAVTDKTAESKTAVLDAIRALDRAVRQAAERGDGRLADRLARPLSVETRARDVARLAVMLRGEEVPQVVVGDARHEGIGESPSSRRLQVQAEPCFELAWNHEPA